MSNITKVIIFRCRSSGVMKIRHFHSALVTQHSSLALWGMISIAERRIRSFIAIQLPRELRSALHELALPLQGLSLNVKWVPENNYHLTLKFLGDIAPGDIHSLDAQLQSLVDRDSFTLSLGGWGMFPRPQAPQCALGGPGRGGGCLAAVVEGYGGPPVCRRLSPRLPVASAHHPGAVSLPG